MKLLPFEANFESVIFRFGLMMAFILTGLFSGQFWMMFFALPVFVSALLAVKFERPVKAQAVELKTKIETPAKSIAA